MKVGFTTGYREDYWAGWPWRVAYGGSEHMVVELAAALAAQGHEVTVRLPRELPEERVWRRVRWVGLSAPTQKYDVLFSFDDFAVHDVSEVAVLVACRSDPPPHTRFDQLVFLSKTHARLMGHPDRPAIGGGVALGHYKHQLKREPRRVIYTSSPDRGGFHAGVIGGEFRFTATYRGAQELSREGLVVLQQKAQALIHPCDPRRPSEFFCMAVLEALAAGTPCVISDADALPELWGDTAIVLPRPIRYTEWVDTVAELLTDKRRWAKLSEAGRLKAEPFDWHRQAVRYMEAAAEA